MSIPGDQKCLYFLHARTQVVAARLENLVLCHDRRGNGPEPLWPTLNTPVSNLVEDSQSWNIDEGLRLGRTSVHRLRWQAVSSSVPLVSSLLHPPRSA